MTQSNKVIEELKEKLSEKIIVVKVDSKVYDKIACYPKLPTEELIDKYFNKALTSFQKENDELNKNMGKIIRERNTLDTNHSCLIEVNRIIKSQLLKAEKNKEEMFKEIEDRLTFINSAVNDARIYKDKVKTIEKQNVANECIFRLHEEEIFLEQLKQKHLKQKGD